ncbi:MAG: acetyl-CoA decarbonylase/synthase complex subunit gamma [Candidatus Omnitrophica bacterium]|jgi:acetyl-CoA decarbonylase/synthase complex subunit gamma|nr:acetyl-CoA decarbonylase/synthase complex subunit gamma [Candidatus Omnitrophota bacterium]MDD5079838.1 acetyl-CoA decarbonylase/synthase complex subunit gamma [Candidatus Omnitrophota bacterium]
MALSGLDIYKLLPKTNCKECGFATCLAFAMQLAKKAVSIDKCPYVNAQVKQSLEAASLPPIRPVIIGAGSGKIEVGNETVMFRHEEKFRNPCALGFIIDDDLKDNEIKAKLARINGLKFERVGQELLVNLVAVKQKSDAKRFVQAVKNIYADTELALVLMSDDPAALKDALAIAKERRPLIYAASGSNSADLGKLAVEFKVPLAVKARDLDEASALTQEMNKLGVNDLIIDVTSPEIKDKLKDLTQIRRLALKKSNRSLGYPSLAVIEEKDPYQEVMAAGTFILKYASIVLMRGIENWQVLSLLTLRQNIYTDPQKPLQIEPKVYSIGQVGPKSPVLVTTNFSLSYYTVVGEVEASKIPSYIISVDTEGMSVLTAWAAEKFTPEKIADSINKFAVADLVAQKKLIIPGYVAVMSGDLEDKSGWEIIVGPKEAAGIPTFLKNLSS